MHEGGGGVGEMEFLRGLARHRWVRTHGTPRVTVIVRGGGARELYESWARLVGGESRTLEGRPVDAMVREAAAWAEREPFHAVAIDVARGELDAWRAGRVDRLATIVDEGLLELGQTAGGGTAVHARAPMQMLDARSAAEATLFEALEATPATRGRFELNAYLSVRFGPGAAEVDLLARGEGVAVEIDGVHHFMEPERYRRDRRKDLLLQTQGLLVLRFLAEDVMRDTREAVNDVCRAFAARVGRPA